ncbi:MAG: ATP-dependent RecD-like DNA helicase [Candidatus Babeliales bacterium]|jgi:exodeoxyribonuclease V alpha subunit
MTEELVGTIERFLFQNNQDGFSVFVLSITAQKTVTVKAHAPALQAGQQVVLKGTWIVHPKFGKQFAADHCTVCLPTSVIGLKKYLGSGMIKGIGKVYAEKLVDYFGTKVLEIIEQEPDRLKEVSGIGIKKIEMIVHAFKDQKEIASIMVFLQDKGVSTGLATKIYKRYGQNSITLIKQNPYRIAEDIWGIGFKSADLIAQNMGFQVESVQRITAGILFTITTQTSNGHLYVELEALKKETITLLELTDSPEIQATIKQALHALYNADKIKLVSYDAQHFITLSAYYFTEKSVASKILKLLEHSTNHHFDIQKLYTQLRVQQPGEIELNQAQQKGIMSCLQDKVTVITGGPGTGKTTLIKKLLQLLDQEKIEYRLAAPTGRAAKRMTEGTGRYAVTLHRLLEFNPQTMSFTHNEQNALKLSYLIIDEASMIDIFLAHSLLKALPLNAHLILIGDIDQLPSVGAGNFLQDLIKSKKITTTRLQYIFRQAHNSLITYNAHRVNQGEFPVYKADNTLQDYEFLKLEAPEQLEQALNSIFTTKLKRYGIKTQNALVLSPMNRGTAGTQHINHYLQGILNGSPKEQLTRMGTVFKVDDRVMQIKNNYDKHVYNGDMGLIESINHTDQIVEVNYYGTVVTYEFLELDELVLAYAVSIHKSQGSEFDAVIIPIFTQHFTLLQRNLIYTALTRAKKFCMIIGQPRALMIAIKNNKSVQRVTFLTQYLTSDLVCR